MYILEIQKHVNHRKMKWKNDKVIVSMWKQLTEFHSNLAVFLLCMCVGVHVCVHLHMCFIGRTSCYMIKQAYRYLTSCKIKILTIYGYFWLVKFEHYEHSLSQPAYPCETISFVTFLLISYQIVCQVLKQLASVDCWRSSASKILIHF